MGGAKEVSGDLLNLAPDAKGRVSVVHPHDGLRERRLSRAHLAADSDLHGLVTK